MSFALAIAFLSKQFGKSHPLVCSHKSLLRCGGNARDAALLATTCRSSVSLPSLGSNTLALGSCLCDNKSKTRQRQAVVLSSIPPRKPCVLCVLCVSASLFRTFSDACVMHETPKGTQRRRGRRAVRDAEKTLAE